MRHDREFVEQIVHKVLARLREQGPRPDGRRQESGPSRTDTQKPSSDNRQLVLNEKVITGDLLEAQVDGHSAISIAADAVVTPTGREFLNKHDVAWMFQRDDPQKGANDGRGNVIVTHTTQAAESALNDFTRQDTVMWSRERVNEPVEAAERIVDALSHSQMKTIVVVSRTAESIICLANRHPAIRGAVISSPQHLEAIKPQMGPNVIAFNPEGKSYFTMWHILEAFRRDGHPETPRQWQELATDGFN